MFMIYRQFINVIVIYLYPLDFRSFINQTLPSEIYTLATFVARILRMILKPGHVMFAVQIRDRGDHDA